MTLSRKLTMSLEYNVLHDHDLPMVFIGDTFHNHSLYNHFKKIRPCQHIRLEETTDKDDTWFLSNQCIAIVTNVKFKKTIADHLINRPVKWFSVIGKSNVLYHNINIGYNTLVNHFNVIYDDAVIGNHCTITNHLSISHEVQINDFCHISPFTYLCFTNVGTGCVVGVRSSFPGKPESPITLPNWTNISMDSRVTKSLEISGTYCGNRLFDRSTSLDKKIL